MLFINNKYTNWYYSLILSAKERHSITGYTEKHHIIPRSMGGSDDPDNLVILTAKEHFVCHLLLTKMTTGLHKRSMAYAAWQMTHINERPRYRISSKIYELLRTTLSQSYKGTFDRRGKKNPFYGKKHTTDTIERQSIIKTGVKNPNYGVIQKPEWNKKKSDSQKGRPKPLLTCEHCNTTVGGHGNYFRWHGDRCRLNKNKGE
jgi:hypothetical protein